VVAAANIVLSLVLTAPVASAEDGSQAPEFLLGDVGVRVDLPAGWKMTRWSDWDLQAEKPDEKLILFAWQTPLQVEPTEADLAGWGELYVAKAESLNGRNPTLVGTRIARHANLPAVVGEVAFTFDGDLPMTMAVVSVPVLGADFHLAVVTLTSRAKEGRETVAALADRLDVQRPPAPAETGPFTAAGVQVTLPEGFRKPVASELPVVAKRLATVGEDDLTDCVLGVLPRAAHPPEVLATCPVKAMWVGQLDTHSFAGIEAELRPRMFGSAPVPAAAEVALADRTALHYTLDTGTEFVHVGVAPYDLGLSRTWVIGPKADEARLSAATDAVLRTMTFSGPHPVTLLDRANYLVYRPAWLAGVVGVAVVLVGGLLGGVVAMTRRGGRKYEDLDG
jgi:hypothetical protein